MEKLKIEAVVKFNDGEALVLNRMPVFKYEKIRSNILYAKDECFFSIYKLGMRDYNLGYKAFGGRKFNIPMVDGSVIQADGQWWDDGYSEVASSLGISVGKAAIKTIDELKKCYVFMGCQCDRAKYSEFRATYTGAVYPYRDYEKVINFDDMRRNGWEKENYLNKRVKALVKEVKRLALQNK